MNVFLTFTVASFEVVQNSFPSWEKLTSRTSSECSSNVSLRCVGVSCVKRWYSFRHEIFPGGKDPWRNFKDVFVKICFTFPKNSFGETKHNLEIKILCGHLTNLTSKLSSCQCMHTFYFPQSLNKLFPNNILCCNAMPQSTCQKHST